jgi:hypothetical protein
MKTAIISTCWLDNDDYLQKTAKFIKYYCQPEVLSALGIKESDIWFVDNASSEAAHEKLRALIPDLYDKVSFKRYTKHYTRTAHLEYPYCWRALYFARELFQEYDYDKVVSTNNDSYIISAKFCQFVKDFQSGYFTPWCNKHSFPECEIQIITKDNEEYWQMTGKPYIEYNGLHMEWTIPTKAEKIFVGDRHCEYGITVQQPGWDFSCQVQLPMNITFNI